MRRLTVLFLAVVFAGMIVAPCRAEGPQARTGERNFESWILLFNPEDEAATASIEFHPEGGGSRNVDLEVPPRARRTVFANEYMDGKGFSTEVTADGPVVAERAEYFRYRGGIGGGHSSSATAVPSRKWYFAEGYTGVGFDEYLTLLNPGIDRADVTATFVTEGGGGATASYRLPANSRTTVHVNVVEGVGQTGVSCTLTGDRPFVAERAMYFSYAGGIEGGDGGPGARAMSCDWFFAEGYTGPGFETYFLLFNPNARPSDAQLYFDTGWP